VRLSTKLGVQAGASQKSWGGRVHPAPFRPATVYICFHWTISADIILFTIHGFGYTAKSWTLFDLGEPCAKSTSYVLLRNVTEEPSTLDLEQCGSTTGPRAACGSPQRFPGPAERFRKNLQFWNLLKNIKTSQGLRRRIWRQFALLGNRFRVSNESSVQRICKQKLTCEMTKKTKV